MHACIDAVCGIPSAKTCHIQNQRRQKNRRTNFRAEPQRPAEGELRLDEGNRQLLLGGGGPNRWRLLRHLQHRARRHSKRKAGAGRAAGFRRLRHRVPHRPLLLGDSPDHVPGHPDLSETGPGLPEGLALDAPLGPQLSLRLHCFHAGFLLHRTFLRAQGEVQEHLVPCLHCHLFACHILCSAAVSSLC